MFHKKDKIGNDSCIQGATIMIPTIKCYGPPLIRKNELCLSPLSAYIIKL